MKFDNFRLEASGAQGSGDGIRWLVADQLGTPRMIFDQTGALANVTRHDYLPFGEELFAGTGGRTTANGYSGDSIRQKFTSYERDNESGLDYAQARYYANTQGRFSSVDPLLASARATNPQGWNRYSYVLNQPVNMIDPSGLSAGCAAEHSNCNDLDSRSSAEREYEERLRHTFNAVDATRAARAGDWDRFHDIMDSDSTLVRREIRVTAVELLDGPKMDSKVIRKGEPQQYMIENPNYLLDVNHDDVNYKSGIFTLAVTFQSEGTGEWVEDSVKASTSETGRWQIAEHPVPEHAGPVRTDWGTDRATVYIHVKARDLEAPNKPITLQISAYYTSLYRSDRRSGIERGTITKKVNISLRIGAAPLTIKDAPGP